MKNVIRASFHKMFHDKAFWVSLAGTAGWSVFIGMALTWIADAKLDVTDVSVVEKYWRDFLGFYVVSIPLLVSSTVLFTSEFKDKSWKLLVARGISKTKIYFAKMLCMLLLSTLITFVAILTGAIYSVAALGVPMSVAYAVSVLKYFALQAIAHGTAAVFVLSVYHLIKASEVSSSLNMILLVFGTMALSKIEDALSLGDALTGCWAFAQHACVSFVGPSDWIHVVVTFAAYLIVCSLAVIVLTSRGDVE